MTESMKIIRYAKNKFFYYYTNYLLRKKVAEKIINSDVFFENIHRHLNTPIHLKFTDGFELKCSDFDLSAIGETCVTEDYQKFKYTQIKPGDVVFDLGANIGSFSVYAAKKGAIVHAFEPSEENYSKLVENIKLNKLDNFIIPHKYGIYSHTGFLELNISETNKGGHSTLPGLSNSVESIQVKTISDVLLDLNISKIDLMKIDIEGAEYSIFENLNLETLKSIKTIVGEYHVFPDYKKNNFKTIKRLLSPHYSMIKPYLPYYFYATN